MQNSHFKLKIILLLFSISIIKFDLNAQSISESPLNHFIGSWEGEAIRFSPRKGLKEERETIKAECKSILDNTYVECTTTWKGKSSERYMNIYFNYNSKEDTYDILFLYHNWPGKVNYPMKYDENLKQFSGSDTFTAQGNIPAQEKVTWKILDNGNIKSTEWNHFQNEDEDFWPKTFEFEWRKVSK